MSKRKYLSAEERFRNIKRGSLVWETVAKGEEIIYYPAVVVGKNKDYLEVIEAGSNHKKRCLYFLTKEGMINLGFPKEVLELGRKKYLENILRVV